MTLKAQMSYISGEGVLMGGYSGALTREQFMFPEMRLVARLVKSGLSDEEIVRRVFEENMFQYPTEKEIRSKCSAVLKRINHIRACDFLLDALADGPAQEAKQAALVALMCQNRLVAEFMVRVIGDKYRMLDMSLSLKDVNLFFADLQAADESVAGWSETTVNRIKSVLRNILRETGYMDAQNIRSEELSPVYISSEFEWALKDAGLHEFLPAFNILE